MDHLCTLKRESHTLKVRKKVLAARLVESPCEKGDADIPSRRANSRFCIIGLVMLGFGLQARLVSVSGPLRIVSATSGYLSNLALCELCRAS